MNIWLITIGEPIFHVENKLRLHRTGILSKLISENKKNINVTWWTSTFNHFTKKQIFDDTIKLNISSNLTMIALKGSGYSRNVSYNRVIDHKLINNLFNKMNKLEVVPDLIVAAFPTIGLCESAINYAKLNKIPIIIDYRDMWPEVYQDLIPKPIRFIGNILFYPLTKKVNNIFRNATGIIGVTESFLKLALKKANRVQNKYDAVFPLGYLKNQFNASDLISARNNWKNILSNETTIRICFFGAIGYQSDWDTILISMEKANEENLPIEFVICGSGDKLQNLIERTKKFKNIKFPGFVSAASINVLMELSDFGLCAFLPKENYLKAIPGKAIEYMSGNLPILNSLSKSDLGNLIKSYNIGFNYDSSDSLLQIIKFCLENKNQINEIKKNIQKLYYNKFDSETVYTNYITHLENCIKKFNGN